jgi:hypothetical protein
MAIGHVGLERGHIGSDVIHHPRTKMIDDGPTCRGFGVPGFIPTLKKED